MKFLIKPLRFPSAGEKIKVYHHFNGRIGAFDNFLCRTTTLLPNTLPHLFHSHMEAELIISLSGNLEIFISNSPQNQIHNSFLIGPGSFVYHSPSQIHTLRCIGLEAAQYLFFKWNRKESQSVNERGTIIKSGDTLGSDSIEMSNGFQKMLIDGFTQHTFGSIKAHLSCLEPNSGYQEESK